MSEVKENFEQIELEVMNQLKDFQRATVEHLDSLYRSGQKRILVSDEVGLGKTLISRGMIAKMARLRMEEGDKLVKVVYICSNAAIAGQNMNKLLISKDLQVDDPTTSRLSMQHLNIFLKETDEETLDRYIQLIPLTPTTSFRVTRDRGTYWERALIFALLRRVPELESYSKEMEILMKDRAEKGWNTWAKERLENRVLYCNEKTEGKYLDFMIPEISRRLKAMVENKTLLDHLVDYFKDNQGQTQGKVDLIGELRIMFASISVDKLEPDFVIMDEFQRFKYLIDQNDESETTMLARHFFENEKTRILLLSATPYKMYSTLEEIDESSVDEHYSEFFKVMEFLNNKNDSEVKFREIWRNYSKRLRTFTVGDTTILEAKNAAEDAMYSVAARTERISDCEVSDIIDDSSVKTPLKPSEADIKSYVVIQNLLKQIQIPYRAPVDYVKSSPYLLSFMRNYQLKRDIESYFKKHPNEMKKAKGKYLWLSRNRIEEFSEIEPANARLEYLQDILFKNEKAHNLLWVPPSRPYYEPQGVFRKTNSFSKVLVFSSWEMVPRMLASLISYESERRNVKVLKDRSSEEARNARYFSSNSKGKRYPAPRLNFAISDGEPKGMPLFCLLYPSRFLADCFNPIDVLNERLDLFTIEEQIKKKISNQLDLLNIKVDLNISSRADERWYYLAPFLLDPADYRKEWLTKGGSLANLDDKEDDIAQSSHKSRQSGFLAHLKTLEEFLKGSDLKLGRKPDDLLNVLATIALASPSICSLRTYQNYAGADTDVTMEYPSQLAKIFINRMNTPESTALIEAVSGDQNTQPHWKKLLTYCKNGNLQAVFDEYAHIIVESNNLNRNERRMDLLHGIIMESMNIHTASYRVDTYNGFHDRLKEKKKNNDLQIRSHFAVAFTNSDGGLDKGLDRKKSVRNSFNSPFRPFVLATTSIGQEGLDFHYYCRKIVHWNLPSNPIDLEQREGRINRFKSLAIRQNVALRYGNLKFQKSLWTEMFEAAMENEKIDQGSELIPFWGLNNSEDMIKIERIVPMYPFSRDIPQYHRLIKILSLYRLTLGQARQEELLEYLYTNNTEEDLQKLFINLSPFYKGSR